MPLPPGNRDNSVSLTDCRSFDLLRSSGVIPLSESGFDGDQPACGRGLLCAEGCEAGAIGGSRYLHSSYLLLGGEAALDPGPNLSVGLAALVSDGLLKGATLALLAVPAPGEHIMSRHMVSTVTMLYR